MRSAVQLSYNNSVRILSSSESLRLGDEVEGAVGMRIRARSRFFMGSKEKTYLRFLPMRKHVQWCRVVNWSPRTDLVHGRERESSYMQARSDRSIH